MSGFCLECDGNKNRDVDIYSGKCECKLGFKENFNECLECY